MTQEKETIDTLPKQTCGECGYLQRREFGEALIDKKTQMIQEIINMLPKYNCGECDYPQCRDFGEALIDKKTELSNCPHLYSNNKFAANVPLIQQIIDGVSIEFKNSIPIQGVIDGLYADFILSALSNESTCREDIYPFNSNIGSVSIGDYVRYRPLGCPVVHFGKVLNINQNILTIHITGPLHRISKDNLNFIDLSICMVLGFDGIVSKGRVPDVGQTVKFLPEYCMMQKIHSGVVVHSENNRVRIEGIDLKVWQL